MRHLLLVVSLLSWGVLAWSDVSAARAAPREPIVGLPCEGCQAVFDGMPADISSITRIAPEREPGEALRIVGVVRDASGAPAPGIIVYAYQTDARGIYPPGVDSSDPEVRRNGRLRAWAKTDEQGRYQFDTIRPGSYPNSRNPQHVHMNILEPGRCTYYIDDLMFDDDPLLTPPHRRTPGRGGPGIASPARDEAGIWLVRRDIVLGQNIPGYPAAH